MYNKNSLTVSTENSGIGGLKFTITLQDTPHYVAKLATNITTNKLRGLEDKNEYC